MPRKTSDIVVGLDIGTTKIAAVVGEVGPDGLDIIGVGTHPSRGLKKGVIVNIDSTVASIKQAILEAESMSGCEISQVYVGIAGGHIKGVNSTGTVAVKDKEVRSTDVHKVLELARAIALPVDRHIIHVLPQEYKIDGQGGVREPLGMCGRRTPPHEAEKIKIRAGCALASMIGEDETLEVASVGGRAPRILSRQMLCRDIIQPRIEEIFSFVRAEIVRLGCEDLLASGAVITGGSTGLPGMTE